MNIRHGLLGVGLLILPSFAAASFFFVKHVSVELSQANAETGAPAPLMPYPERAPEIIRVSDADLKDEIVKLRIAVQAETVILGDALMRLQRISPPATTEK